MKADANVANAAAKVDVNVANARSAAPAKPPMPTQANPHWEQNCQQTPALAPKAPARPKTVNAANAARVTAMAVTAANVLAKLGRTLPSIQPPAMTAPKLSV